VLYRCGLCLAFEEKVGSFRVFFLPTLCCVQFSVFFMGGSFFAKSPMGESWLGCPGSVCWCDLVYLIS